jgi:DNA-binding transcriptional LysR family regulator
MGARRSRPDPQINQRSPGNLMDGRLEAVLQDQMPTDRAYYAIYPQRQIMPTKLNAFIDFILETYGPSPSWSEPL